MTPPPLTPRQREVLAFMLTELTAKQRLPTNSEISAYIGAASRTAGFLYFRLLEVRGYLTREPGPPGGSDVVRIVRDPDGHPIHLEVVVDHPPTTPELP